MLYLFRSEYELDSILFLINKQNVYWTKSSNIGSFSLLVRYAFDCSFKTSELYDAPAIGARDNQFDELVIDYCGVYDLVGFFALVFGGD